MCVPRRDTLRARTGCGGCGFNTYANSAWHMWDVDDMSAQAYRHNRSRNHARPVAKRRAAWVKLGNSLKVQRRVKCIV
ncbi:hypothetical protein AG1IA_09106 [Rhizoctonia solani AG-1 IA]|uniref:Uncharacterized protein n=1 Tax=Thanatephorus cucumeris (strain AG1-IA) TaxID=983506 RepID=L8WJ75_THACA|nr:hypothetical protein AG1IA_09106 [Rhizoctonia solani AG-1 IA]